MPTDGQATSSPAFRTLRADRPGPASAPCPISTKTGVACGSTITDGLSGHDTSPTLWLPFGDFDVAARAKWLLTV
jgi:hypothetical protein